MPSPDKTAMPIGAVAQLTGISSHTLRKWESRYGVIEPVRSDSGRRLYTQDQVHKLVLLRDLVERGHQISQLSQLELDELETLAAQGGGEERAAAVEYDEIVLVGQVLTATLAAQPLPAEATLVAEPAAAWLQHAGGSTAPGSAARALVIEVPTLSQRHVETLLALRQDRFQRLVVIYGFTTQATARRLQNGGIVCLKAPVTAAEVFYSLARADAQRGIAELLASASVPAPRFAVASIAEMAALAPSVQCECPNHIARLLMEISAFEQYSMECEDEDPDERALHARLRLIAAQARALFEEALENVARAEGLPLEEL